MTGLQAWPEGASAGSRQPAVSVAMCTCNGERYLSDQLASILRQTRLPDEVVVCDDNSTDDTRHILEQFSTKAPFPVRIHHNEQRLGAAKNFQKAISLCTGDVIFLSDQDDVWMPEKIERLLQALAKNADAGYAFSNSSVVDETLRPTGRTVWQAIGFTPRQFQKEKQVNLLVRYNVVTGAAMAFRAELRDIVLPIADESVHDEWIALVASSAGLYGMPVEECLVCYRRHPGQAIGLRSFVQQVRRFWLMRGPDFGSWLLKQEMKYSKALERLAVTGRLDGSVHELFQAKIRHLRVRQSIHKRPYYARLPGVLRLLMTREYHRFSSGWKSAAMDMLL